MCIAYFIHFYYEMIIFERHCKQAYREYHLFNNPCLVRCVQTRTIKLFFAQLKYKKYIVIQHKDETS